ncbi:MAG: alanine--tRNA ligase [Candidatus Bathyarchaeia archaeon]
MKRFPKSAYHVPFFDEYGFVRRLCPTCREYFWTQNPGQRVCGESTPEGCSPYTFIRNPPTRRPYSLGETREAFLHFFEERGHERIKPYPVVARWRDDLYLTHASIIDFQPYVTEGMIPPPANPLVISQPCIRLLDVDNVGPTFGRHLTIFEMGGAHAFNYPDKEVYWKDQTVRYHHEFVTEELGVRSEEVVYKEGVWSGGGNAGPDLEAIIRGLEVATLVFMNFRVVNGDLVQLPIRTVDTGYGMERYTWLSQGSVSAFHGVYGPVLREIMKMANVDEADDELVKKVAEFSGVLSLGEKANRREAEKRVAEALGIDVEGLRKALFPLENVFAVTDHTKCLAFMLAEGVVPSNVREGYLTRLMLRRTYRALRNLGMEERLLNVIDMQIDFWSKDFPHLKEMRKEILEILSAEMEKFKQTLQRGGNLVKKTARELKAQGITRIPMETLMELYDSHGLPPEIVKEVAEDEGVLTEVPEDFYTMVAKRHVQAPPLGGEGGMEELKEGVSDLPETRELYYEDSHLSEFEATVLRVIDEKYVVLDKTAFYPEGGGQLADQGHLKFDEGRSEIVDVQKVGRVIVHEVKGPLPREGAKIGGFIDWNRRSSLMRHHTATHLVMGAARRVLGEHVWQAGAQKGVERARLDISHYKRLTLEEAHEIERLANEVVMRNLPVEVWWMPREEAERKYGFRLYQGGVVPGRKIRVLKVGEWDVEACGGTHCKTTGEVGFIKILHTERIQDGVERIVFSAGPPALRAVQETERILLKASEILNVPPEKVEKTLKSLMEDYKETRREKERLMEEISKTEAKKYLEASKEIGGLRVITQSLKGATPDHLIKVASQLIRMEPEVVVVLCGINKTARVVVMAGEAAVERGIDARKIAGEAAAALGGGGSGKPDFAQGGGTKIERVQEALERAEETVKRQLERKG